MEMIRDCFKPDVLEAMRRVLEAEPVESESTTASRIGEELRRKRDDEVERRARAAFERRRARVIG